MANTDNPNGFKPVRNLCGGAIPQMEFEFTAEEAASEGDLVVITSGYVTKADAASTAILGVLAEDVSASAAGVHPKANVYLAAPWVLFEAQCDGTYTVATQRGIDCDVIMTHGTGAHEIDEN